jgi:hypothetical protein
MTHEYCKYHIGGLYNDSTKKFRGNKSIHFITNPLLLIKHRESSQEYLLPNCQSSMKIGEVSLVYHHLTK